MDTDSSRRSIILVVDDDEVVCATAEVILKKSYTVKNCLVGVEAPEYAGELRPDLILLDINMTGMDGFEVFERLKQNSDTSDIPVMYITADEDRDKEVMALKKGAQDLIRKPFVPEVLLQRCERIIALDRYQKNLKGEVTRQTDRAERLYKEMMHALSHTVDAKDHYTNGHSERVAAYSAEIARRMGMSVQEQETLYEIGLLHDIGKIGVPEEIINKTERLTDEEFGKIKEHTVIGYDILMSITDMPVLKMGARHHHEKYDGSGYPDGLSGEDIPIEARIVCVADCYDAMTSTRTYSNPKPQADVRAEILRCKGKHFDPDVADVMISMIDDDKDYVMNEKGGGLDVWKGNSLLWNGSAPRDVVTDTEPARNDLCTISDSAETAVETEINTDAELPTWLDTVKDIDVKSGVENCGSNESFMAVLETFHRTAGGKADEIESLFKNKDIETYTIKVHALKSSARIIGASELSDMARRLEQAGKDKDTDTIESDTEALLKRYRDLDRELDKLDVKTEDLLEFTPGCRKEAYRTIVEVASCMDYGMMEGILNDLKRYSLPEADRKVISDIGNRLMELDWEGIEDLASSQTEA